MLRLQRTIYISRVIYNGGYPLIDTHQKIKKVFKKVLTNNKIYGTIYLEVESNTNPKLLQIFNRSEVIEMTKTNKSINEVIKEIKEYQELQEQLKAQIEELKAEAIEYLNDNQLDEYMCDTGKVTYREVLSNRFQSTEFKKIHADLYNAFTKKTSSMRFTCN